MTLEIRSRIEYLIPNDASFTLIFYFLKSLAPSTGFQYDLMKICKWLTVFGPPCTFTDL